MRRINHPWVNDEEWPLLCVRFADTGTIDDVVSLFKAVETFYASNTQPFAWVVDAGGIGIVDAKVRQVTASHEERTKLHKARFNQGSAFVIKSPMARGIVTAIFWIAPPVYRHEVVSNFESARAWALAQLQRPAADRAAASDR